MKFDSIADDGSWIFARKGNGGWHFGAAQLVLYSDELQDSEMRAYADELQDSEMRAYADDVAYVCYAGDGDYDAFKSR